MSDFESDAAEAVFRVLRELDEDGRRRVLRWAADRFEMRESSQADRESADVLVYVSERDVPADGIADLRFSATGRRGLTDRDFVAVLKAIGTGCGSVSEFLNSRHRVVWVVVRRLVLAVPILVVAPLLTFWLGRLTLTYTQSSGDGGLPQTIEARPMAYGEWFSHALHGDLGTSLITNVSVMRTLRPEIGVTATLVVGTLLLSAVVGGALGVVSAVRGGMLGRVLDALAVLGIALPGFWLGPVLFVYFAADLHWVPGIFLGQREWSGAWFGVLVLPVVTLAVGGIAAVATQMREAMLDTLGSEYIRMARARGIPARSVVFRHALKTAAPKVITVLGVLTAGLSAGTVFVEYVFNLQGLGNQLLTSLEQHDLPLVVPIALFWAMLIVAINLLIDLAHTWLNPRVGA